MDTSFKHSEKNSFLNKFCVIFHFLSLSVFILIQNIGRSIPLRFINNFQLLSCSLDNLVKNLSQDDFKCLSQEFDNVLDLVKQNGFFLMIT